jgi:hypothetical protein
VTLDEMLAMLQDNTSGDITAAALRAIVTDLFTASVSGNQPGPWPGLAASPVYVPLNPDATVDISLALASPVLVTFTAYVDTAVNNNEVGLAIALTGATNVAAGSNKWQTLRQGAKTATTRTASITYLQDFGQGTTTAELRYTAAQAGATISDLALDLVVLASGALS